MTGEDLLKDTNSVKPEMVLRHCFKQYKLRDLYPKFFLKVKPSIFGPPKSRRRIIIAPPMVRPAFAGSKPIQITPIKKDGKEEAADQQMSPGAESCPHTLKEPSEAEDDLPMLESWITERRKLRSQLDSLVNVEKWLRQKLSTTEQEDRVLENIQYCRAERKAKIQAAVTRNLENLSAKHDQPHQKRIIPLIKAPYPQSLITLHNLLHKQKLKMVDLFKKADKDKKRFVRSEFIKVIKGANVPISDNDLEDVIIYLTTSKRENFITSDDLADCQNMWLDSMRDQMKQPREAKRACSRFHTRKAVSKTVCRPASADGKTKETEPLAPSEPTVKLTLLEVPPINLEPDHRPLNHEEMEEIGKRWKERKRCEKIKVSPIQWMERCRLVRSGNNAIDEHCLPSTMESEIGEIIDKHRRTIYMVYLQSLKLCNEYNIPLTEKVLERALLYPGDKIIKEGAYVRKIRQPGGPYSTVDGSRHQKQLLLSRQGLKGDAKNGLRGTGIKRQLYGNQKAYRGSEMSFDDYEQLTRHLHMKWSNLSCRSNDNNFWPGHLLDKLRIYLPQIKTNQEHALFSYIHPTPPAYPGIYNPHHSWPVSDQGYVTYGNTDTQKY
uniref:EF-hand calcium binding domain 12 n=1 Tax=Pelodiscus sinensis TaxID=13735 RepID=K7FKL7_PELSI|nr:EF-hand calcium-binding domain-containing protein 12 [Pelodiscus sinensis]XP_025045353.1 EF-hand calcium-binding domain-containing protein 12 [Pelodiscus sinensis]|eukprot:XP_006132888.1 EF-hand calcium-binding domain-containing protein 12 [Pelodiscus sinensis]